MTKAEKKKLHEVLTRMAGELCKINKSLAKRDAVEKLIHARIEAIETSIANLFLVVQETQDQQRASQPALKVVGGKNVGTTGRQKSPKSDR